MNILETLVQLRDDLKTWVTANLNALNSKIEEKTIPIDSELSSTSTNPVQNKVISAELDSLNSLVGDTPVATQISTAIASQEHFSGDYNDLTNAPNIVDDGSGEVVYADDDGNIIFKIDADGAHTTDVKIAGQSIKTKMSEWDAKSGFSGDYNDLTNAPNITEDNSKNVVIADESGNIIFQVDEVGAHTTALTLNGEDVKTAIDAKAAQSSLDTTNANVSTLQGLVGDTAVSAQIAEAIANQDLFSGDYNDLTNRPNITEDNSYNVVIADDAGNIIFRVDASGIHSTALTLNGEDISEQISNAVAQKNLIQIITWESDD